jgi:hypothetical protein
MIVDNKRLHSYLQVIFRSTYWTHLWVILQEKVQQSDFEMDMSHTRDGGNGDFRQEWMTVFFFERIMDGCLLIDLVFSWRRLLFCVSLFESMLF